MHGFRVEGTNGNDFLKPIVANRQVGGFNSETGINGQYHIFAMSGDDTIPLDFAPGLDQLSHGHHVRGDHDAALQRGRDVFKFVNTASVSGIVTGRVEDFQLTDGNGGLFDRIVVDDRLIDFDNLPENVRIVEYNGAYNDSSNVPQQWLLIETSSGGVIFYTLEGARVDNNAINGSGGGEWRGSREPLSL